MAAELCLRIALGVFFVAALCAVCWMMFHGRRFLPDSGREELRECQRGQDDKGISIWRSWKTPGILAVLVVFSLGLEMTRSAFWEASWTARLGMLALKVPLLSVLAMVMAVRFLKRGS